MSIFLKCYTPVRRRGAFAAPREHRAASSTEFPISRDRQSLDGPKACSRAPANVVLVLNGELKLRPTLEQGLKRALAFDTRELMAEAKMNPGAEGDMPVRFSLEIELLGMFVRLRVEVCGGFALGNEMGLADALCKRSTGSAWVGVGRTLCSTGGDELRQAGPELSRPVLFDTGDSSANKALVVVGGSSTNMDERERPR